MFNIWKGLLAGLAATLVLSALMVMKTIMGVALLHKSKAERDDPNPRRSYAMATTGTVVGRPSCVKRLSSATRTCNSAT